jgi:hypothetical protein
MVAPVDPWLEAFREAGADVLTVHPESGAHLHRTLGRIRQLGAKAGVVFNPATPLSILEEVVDLVDLVLIMSVNPGFGGQKFIDSSLKKIETARAILDRAGSAAHLQVDGGVTSANAGACVGAGADAPSSQQLQTALAAVARLMEDLGFAKAADRVLERYAELDLGGIQARVEFLARQARADEALDLLEATWDSLSLERALSLAIQVLRSQTDDATATDDAMMLEAAGETVVVVPGEADNRKITTPDDLAWARTVAAR